MVTKVEIRRSHLPHKKYDAVIDGRKTIPFGQRSAEDYTMHKDEARKENYLRRHKPTENWNDPKSAGFYSRWITWNKSTLRESVADVNKKFKNLEVRLKV